MAETKLQKAHRYLVEGRLTVMHFTAGGSIIAKCKGDSGELYDLGFDRDRQEWRCTCEANAKFRRECSHLIALKLVTVKPKEGT